LLIAGAGKTVLASTLLNDLVLPRRLDESIVAYYYFDFRDRSSQTSDVWLGSLLSQVCSQLGVIPDAVEKSFHDHMETTNHQRRSADFEELVSLLLTILSENCDSVILVLDALDECIEKPQILSFLARLDAISSPVLVFVTSRPEEVFDEHFIGRTRIEIQDQVVAEDVRADLKDTMTKIPRLKRLEAEFKEVVVVQSLTQRCNLTQSLTRELRYIYIYSNLESVALRL
jgi:hypothetical protein